MRQTPNGQNVTTFGIATNREWATKDGDRKNSAEFHECVAWAKLAEICSMYLKKGQLVYVEGYLKTRSWDSPEGIKKFKTEIVVKDMIRLEKRSRDSEGDDYVPSDDEDMELADIEAPLPDHDETPAAPEAAPAPEASSAEPTAPAPEAAPEVPAEPAESTPTTESPIDKDLGL